MKIYGKLMKAMEEKDASGYIDVLHEDYTFVRHQTGTSMDKNQMSEMMVSMMANPKVIINDSRCIYENDEILVEHSVMDFPDGSREAVMSVHTIVDGKIIQSETGATLIE